MVLGSGFMIPGFEDQLIGRSVGDEVTIEVTFPAEFPKPELAGKPASFAVQVKELGEPKPVELNDEIGQGPGLREPRRPQGRRSARASSANTRSSRACA